MNIENLSIFLAVIGMCIGAVNIITEVLKAVFIKEETSKPLVVFIVSEFVCAIVLYGYCVIKALEITPLLIIGGVIGGFFLSYGAMYGYDKLYGDFLKGMEALYKDKRTK